MKPLFPPDDPTWIIAQLRWREKIRPSGLDLFHYSSGNRSLDYFPMKRLSDTWIPVFAGMTGMNGRSKDRQLSSTESYSVS
jgi:hypothetical protein